MSQKIKQKIDKELAKFLASADKVYSLTKISPLLYSCIKDFILRDGKRVRPILFLTSYFGFTKKIASGIYKSALSLELLHDYMLIHDDIIDKSDTRRGLPSMHKMLNNYLEPYKKIKFSGQDLGIVVGDVIHSLSTFAFLSVKENPKRKELALKKILEAATYTASGEFIELISGLTPIERITKEDIYKIYDYKTAHYSFSSPLAAGAILAGANKKEITKLVKLGIYLGRAFQIKDDIIGIFKNENTIGKPALSDLQEGKKTLIMWQAYKSSGRNNKNIIKKILSKEKVTKLDLSIISNIIKKSGALDYAKNEINILACSVKAIVKALPMRKKQKNFITEYSRIVLEI